MTAKRATANKSGSAKRKNPYKRLKLKNGLSVLLIENHKSPVVSVQMWVKTGSADETRGEEGISHFIEHLVFKGTDKFKVGEIASTVEASGGELNAYTSFDQTVFYVNISREFADVGERALDALVGGQPAGAARPVPERRLLGREVGDAAARAGSHASAAARATTRSRGM